VQILELVRLRLEASQLPAGITGVELLAESTPASHEQLRFFAGHPRRDLAAGNRALARLRAELGEHAVVRAQLRDGHLPEARVAWEPVASLRLPRPVPAAPRTLVRRIFERPVPLPLPPRRPRDDGWLILGTASGAVAEVLGPYVVSGGWWVQEVDRAYHFVRTRRGDLLWVYLDRRRRRWFLHGRVE
jgi:protein ImuB